MNHDVLRHLRCPVCSGELSPAPAALRCPRGHSFDVARQGYVNLTAGRPVHPGDTPEMVAARAAFLDAGHYDFISSALACFCTGFVVDSGAGTGHHLAAVLDAQPSSVGLALDASKPAVRRAARAHPRAGAALCDTWQGLPVASGSADLLLNVFAPRNGAEFHRVLREGGTLLVVTPTAGHLASLVGPLGLLTVDEAKDDRVAASLSPWFVPLDEQRLERTLHLTHNEVQALVAMGPSAHHIRPVTLATRISTLPTLVPVTASVTLRRFLPR
jgi:23S rRNA (guanine745-N1)-methyltransferase